MRSSVFILASALLAAANGDVLRVCLRTTVDEYFSSVFLKVPAEVVIQKDGEIEIEVKAEVIKTIPKGAKVIVTVYKLDVTFFHFKVRVPCTDIVSMPVELDLKLIIEKSHFVIAWRILVCWFMHL